MKMHGHPLWLTFLAALALGVFWYSGNAGWKYYRYYSLTASTRPTQLSWQIGEVSDEEYPLIGSYTYIDPATGDSKAGSWSDRPFRNRWAAEQALPDYGSKEWLVWFSPNSQYSSLQKSFPIKECISAAVLWLLLLYFIWLGFYVTRYRI
jgi:hypothetical protein